MKRVLRAGAWIMMIALIALAPIWAAILQEEREINPVREYYSSWTGVLRLWKCEGWQSGSGSLTGWLSACIGQFEKKHPGVYVQATDVSAETMADFMNGSVNPPDVLLFAPGMLEAPYSLMELPEETQVRGPLRSLGLWQGARYAVPVALGGYAMAINSRLLPQTPDNWRMHGGAGEIDLLNAPKDDKNTSWSAALISMFSGNAAIQSEGEPAPVDDGIDLGLPDGGGGKAQASGKETAPPQWTPNALPAALPKDFGTGESVYSQFTGGEIAAMPVTQREIRRLQQLSESGKAPDWRVECMGALFTDQAALIAVVACDRADIEDRQALCMELIHCMLSGRMQSQLTAARAFPVIELPPLYGKQAGMKEIEKALCGDDLLLPPAFGEQWRDYAARLLDEIGAGEETQAAYEMLHEIFVRQEGDGKA